MAGSSDVLSALGAIPGAVAGFLTDLDMRFHLFIESGMGDLKALPLDGWAVPIIAALLAGTAVFALAGIVVDLLHVRASLLKRHVDAISFAGGGLSGGCAMLVALSRSLEQSCEGGRGGAKAEGGRKGAGAPRGAAGVSGRGAMSAGKRATVNAGGHGTGGAGRRMAPAISRQGMFAGDMEVDEMLLRRAGLSELMSVDSLPALKARCSVIVGATLALVCLPLSATLAFAGLIIGCLVGAHLPERTISSQVDRIRAECDREVPVMLDIIALSSRAGMSFDRAFETYMDGFDSELSRRCRRCRAEYTQGAKSRENALRDLADELDLMSFRHFAEAAIQAIHFGVPLTETLEDLAEQVRSQERADVAARIAKAPVKMLIPVGLFILPAMLLLVLGPVVLNMLSGVA